MPNLYIISPALSKTCVICRDWKASKYVELKDKNRIPLCERCLESNYERIVGLTLKEFEVQQVMDT